MNGDEINSELTDELNETKDQLKEMQLEKKFMALLTDIKERLIRIEDKIVIHNNYEGRIRSLENDKYKVVGIFVGFSAMIGAAIVIIEKLWK